MGHSDPLKEGAGPDRESTRASGVTRVRDTLRVDGPPDRAPAEEVRSELARLRDERDQAVRRYKAALFVAEALTCLGIATLFWFAVAQ